MNTVWHYAVWKGNLYSMTPACVKYHDDLNFEDGTPHGITLVRGDVSCSNCKRMMGMVE